jgi:hypothetical protein
MEPEFLKTIKRLRILLVLACVLSGFLAGENIDRYLVQVPAWHHLDIHAWAEFVKHADLGNGRFVYPAEAILAAALLSVASAIAVRRKKEMLMTVFPLYLSAIFALAGLVFTFYAAPNLLNIGEAENNPAALQQTFDNFHFWGSFRAAVQVLSFLFCVWAMANIFRFHPAKSSSAT